MEHMTLLRQKNVFCSNWDVLSAADENGVLQIGFSILHFTHCAKFFGELVM